MKRFIAVFATLLGLIPAQALAQRANAAPAPPPGAEASWPDVFVSTSHGAQWLEVDSVEIEESLGAQTSASVRAHSDRSVSPQSLAGQRMLIGVRTGPGSFRHFQGYATDITSGRDPSGKPTYSFRVVPWLRLLSLVATCEVYENLTVPQIVERIFARHRFADFELRLTDRYPVRPLEVQYRESDLNFVSRILEQEGIYMFVKHRVDGHTLVLTDRSGTRPQGPTFRVTANGSGPGVFTMWTENARLRPTRYTLADHVYETGADPIAGTATIRNRRGGELEIFDYPGEYRTRTEANRYARIRLQEIRNNQSVYSGWTDSLDVSAGDVIRVDGDPYFVTGASLSVDGSNHGMGGGASVTAIPATRRYRPSRVTPKPMVQGVQSATVSEVEPGSFGRVRVRFQWDRSSRPENGAWLRVVQPLSEASAVLRPAVGQEVLVAFLEGDPNRPVVVGLLYSDAARQDAAWPGSAVEALP